SSDLPGGIQWTAKERGFFEANGLDVTLTSLQGTAQIPALVNGEVQLANVAPPEIASAVLGGASLVAIASSSELPGFSLMANKKYSTFSDLAGQTIGVTAIGSSSDAYARLLLRKYNLEGKVTITAVGGSTTTI